MKINFNAFRLKFFLLGMVIVFFLIGVLKRLLQVVFLVLFSFVFFGVSAVFAGDLLESCTPPFHGCLTTTDGWNVGSCVDVCGNTVGQHPCLVGPYTCGVGYMVYGPGIIGCEVYAGGCSSGNGGCTGSAGSGVWDHFAGVCTSTDPDVDCRFGSGTCIPCDNACMSSGGGCATAGVCIPCPSSCLAAGSQCSKSIGVCDLKCLPPYVWNAQWQICKGPKGSMPAGSDAMRYIQKYGKEQRLRYLGRGGYEVKQ